MAIQEYKETGGEKWDYEDTPAYWQQRDAEEQIIINEIEREQYDARKKFVYKRR